MFAQGELGSSTAAAGWEGWVTAAAPWAENLHPCTSQAHLDTVLGNLLQVTLSQRGGFGLHGLQRSCPASAIEWISCGAVISP